jgi:hypothetical protein
MRSSARSLIATAAATKTCVFANALESCRRATRFYCCGQVGSQEYSEFSNSTLLISSAPGIGTNRQLGISRNSEYRKIPLTEYFPFRAVTPNNCFNGTVPTMSAPDSLSVDFLIPFGDEEWPGLRVSFRHGQLVATHRRQLFRAHQEGSNSPSHPRSNRSSR